MSASTAVPAPKTAGGPYRVALIRHSPSYPADPDGISGESLIPSAFAALSASLGAAPPADHDASDAPVAAPQFEVVNLAWTDESADWNSFDFAVVRTPYDYPDRFAEWSAFLTGLPSSLVLLNSKRALEWNGNKMYLIDLERQGVPMVPSVLCPFQESIPQTFVADTLAGWPAFDSGRVVVKPVHGNDGKGVRLFSDPSAAQAFLAANAPVDESSGSQFLLQPFLPSVKTRGELSMMFFAQEFSHALFKRIPPSAGSDHIIISQAFTDHYAPSTELIALGLQALQGANVALGLEKTDISQVSYARVDVLFSEEGMPMIGELEIFEPNLFLSLAPKASEKLVSGLWKSFLAASSAAAAAGAQ